MVGRVADLLDANVLLALTWPNHAHHAAAHRWFAARRNQAWASCALTQAAFLRVSMNARIHGVEVRFEQALDMLSALTGRAGHEYWDRLPAAHELTEFAALLVQGHRQITDAYLLALARQHDARLVTLDTGIPTLITRPSLRSRWVELIQP